MKPEDEFDFWLGEWSLTWDADHHGTNRITRILKGRIIQENFREAGDEGLHGMSVSAYDAGRGLWCQTWVDNQGGYLDFTGRFENGRVVLARDGIVKGQPCKQRMVWYDIQSDRLEWNWERSDDGGRTWRVLWQIHYSRTR